MAAPVRSLHLRGDDLFGARVWGEKNRVKSWKINLNIFRKIFAKKLGLNNEFNWFTARIHCPETADFTGGQYTRMIAKKDQNISQKYTSGVCEESGGKLHVGQVLPLLQFRFPRPPSLQCVRRRGSRNETRMERNFWAGPIPNLIYLFAGAAKDQFP